MKQIKVRNLLTRESKWCQGAYAQTKKGKDVLYNHSKAVRWCLWGAMKKCYGTGEEFKKIYEKVNFHLHGIITWNDKPYRKFIEVKKIIDRLDI